MLGLRARIGITAVAASAAALAGRPPDRAARACAGARPSRRARRLLGRGPPRGAPGGSRRSPTGGRPPELDALVDAAGARPPRARHRRRARRTRGRPTPPRPGRALAALENHARPARDPGGPARRPRARPCATARRWTTTSCTPRSPSATAGRLLGVARVALPLRGVREQAREPGGAVMVALVLAFAITALLSRAALSSLAGPLQERDGGRAPVRGRQPGRAQRGVAPRTRSGELARILNRSADQLQDAHHRDRPRPRAHRRHPLRDGGRRAGGRPPAAWCCSRTRRCAASLGLRDPLGRPYVEAVRQREVGQVLEHVLADGRAQGDGGRSCTTCAACTRSPACPSPAPRARRTARCSPSTT